MQWCHCTENFNYYFMCDLLTHWPLSDFSDLSFNLVPERLEVRNDHWLSLSFLCWIVPHSCHFVWCQTQFILGWSVVVKLLIGSSQPWAAETYEHAWLLSVIKKIMTNFKDDPVCQTSSTLGFYKQSSARWSVSLGFYKQSSARWSVN